MMNSKDVLARLLAAENLNVVRARAKTAAFDIASRTLVLPLWKEMTEDVEDMLIAHEVGHALFTSDEYLKTENYRAMHGYLNVVEDVRIERMMKNKYPGLRKTFIAGYKNLNDRDFFEVKDKDLSRALLIDRINIYYKVGINSGVKFSPAEMELVRRVDKCDTIQDVQLLAKEIYEFSFEQLKKRQEELKNQKLTAEDLEDIEESIETDIEIEFGDEGDDDEFFDGEYDPYSESEESEEPNDNGFYAAGDNEYKTPGIVEEKDLESTTERALRVRLQDLADINTIVQRWEPTVALLRDSEQIVPYKEIFKVFDEDFAKANFRGYYDSEEEKKKKKDEVVATMITNAQNFKTESSRIVNYLVKEFEMRKSATAYRRSKISKAGTLNVNKLAMYQLTDDIFKRITVTKDDKSHGMVMLIDWSGSMMDNIINTLKQTITLVMFCQRTQIPFRVYGFSNGYDRYPRDKDNNIIYPENRYKIDPAQKQEPNFKGFTNADVYLLELFSDKMTNSEFTKMMQICLSNFWYYSPRLTLNSTPLNEALLFMVNYLGEFKRKNSVEKLTFITLTDGEGGSLHGNYEQSISEYVTVYEPEYKRCKVLNYMVDPITKKEYRITQESSTQTNIFLKIIKDRYDATTIGFYIGRNSRRDLTWFVRNNITSAQGGVNDCITVDSMQKEIRKNDFALLTNCGRDELYVIPSSKLAIKDEELEVSDAMNSKQIAKAFNKYLNVQKTNRILLNRFIGLVA